MKMYSKLKREIDSVKLQEGPRQKSLYSPILTLAVLEARPQTQAPHMSKYLKVKSNPKTVH